MNDGRIRFKTMFRSEGRVCIVHTRSLPGLGYVPLLFCLSHVGINNKALWKWIEFLICSLL